jgi:hypothetical protein
VTLARRLLGAGTARRRLSFTRAALPVTAVLVCTAAAMGLYNMRTTGSVLRMPYQIHEAAYAVVPNFLLQEIGPAPVYRHATMRSFFTGWCVDYYNRQEGLRGFAVTAAEKIRDLIGFYFGRMLALPLIALPLLWGTRRMRFILVSLAIFGIALLNETWYNPHYVAPVAGLLYLVLVQCLRHWRTWTIRGVPAGRVAVLLLTVVIAGQLAAAIHRAGMYSRGWQFERSRLITRLKQDGRRHLVIVRYRDGHRWQNEWVFNQANIDGAPVVWARDMDARENRKLIEYFADRTAWVLDADAAPPALTPYSTDSTAPSEARADLSRHANRAAHGAAMNTPLTAAFGPDVAVTRMRTAPLISQTRY